MYLCLSVLSQLTHIYTLHLTSLRLCVQVGNKGGVAVRFRMYSSSVCLVCTHLAAGKSHVAERNNDFADIARKLDFGKVGHDTDLLTCVLYSISLSVHLQLSLSLSLSQYLFLFFAWPHSALHVQGLQLEAHDNIVWFGDLNYRIDLENEQCRQLCEEQVSISLFSLHVPFSLTLSHTGLGGAAPVRPADPGASTGGGVCVLPRGSAAVPAHIQVRPLHGHVRLFREAARACVDRPRMLCPLIRPPHDVICVLISRVTSQVLFSGDLASLRYECNNTLKISDHRPVLALLQLTV